MTKEKPKRVFQRGACQVRVFTRDVKEKGLTHRIPEIEVVRRYPSRKGQWKHSRRFEIYDVSNMIEALVDAYNDATGKELDFGCSDEEEDEA